MKSGRTKLIALSVFAMMISVMVLGCPKPEAEMKRAQAAIQEAKDAGAAEYASSELASAEKALADGKTLMDGWSYKKAKAKFEEAYRLALAAKEKALAAQKPCPEQPVVDYTPPPTTEKTHTVVKGECLWWIAESDDAYSDPFQWPLIYWENQDEIDSTAHSYGHHNKEEDWIYPGQEFTIPPNDDVDQVKKARRKAGAPAPYTPPGQ